MGRARRRAGRWSSLSRPRPPHARAPTPLVELVETKAASTPHVEPRRRWSSLSRPRPARRRTSSPDAAGRAPTPLVELVETKAGSTPHVEPRRRWSSLSRPRPAHAARRAPTPLVELVETKAASTPHVEPRPPARRAPTPLVELVETKAGSSTTARRAPTPLVEPRRRWSSLSRPRPARRPAAGRVAVVSTSSTDGGRQVRHKARLNGPQGAVDGPQGAAQRTTRRGSTGGDRNGPREHIPPGARSRRWS